MTPESTPYDITALPAAPYEPGIVAWLVLAGIIVLFATLVAFRARRGPHHHHFHLLYDELTTLVHTPRPDLPRISGLIRAYLAVELGQPVTGFTPRELATFAPEGGALRPLCVALASIEEARFAGHAAPSLPPLLDLLRSFREERTAPKKSMGAS